jgi:mannose-6-phosphate isomerase
MTEIRPFLLDNTVQHYEWGTRNAEAFIPHFLGIPAEDDLPYAELWIGAHPKAPSSVRKNSEHIALPDFIGQAPEEILGAEAAGRFSSELPFLLKVLSAGEPLSIQAHPNRQQAAGLHARDPQHYPDPNHKPEIAVALTHLTALAGFKPFGEIARTLQRYPVLAALAGEVVSGGVIDAAGTGTADTQRAALKEFFRALMTRSLADPALLEETIDTLEGQMREGPANEEIRLFLETRRLYRTDVGLLSMLLLNLMHLNKGEGLFLGPGIPHAYLSGTIVECMANSDNVVRAGLTPKFKDVETLCAILTYECGVPPVMLPNTSGQATVYPSPVSEFSLARTMMNESDSFFRRDRRSLEIMLVIEGSVSISQKTGRQLFKQGDSVLIPAAVIEYELTAHTNAELFFASIPD